MESIRRIFHLPIKTVGRECDDSRGSLPEHGNTYIPALTNARIYITPDLPGTNLIAGR